MLFTDRSDLVQCFSCMLLVKSWKPAYDPWHEHISRSPECEHVLLMNGRTAVMSIGQTVPEKKPASTARVGNLSKCTTCLINELCIVLLPCCHYNVCFDCASRTRSCSVCTRTPKGFVKVYMS